jgi:protein disulfide-isomerase-like protein
MRPGKYVLLACAVFGLLSTSGAVELTRDNYDEMTAGKSVLLKLYAPWCTHCKAIKPAWDALMKQYEGHADVLVGESDCTAAGKTLCEDMQVQGYPTLKYGDPASLTDYQGARDLEGLKRFADSELRPACSLARLELCDAAQRERIEELQELSPLELAAEIANSEKELAELETKFKRDVEELQREYKELQDAKAAAAAAVRAGGLGLMRAVQAAVRRAGSGASGAPAGAAAGVDSQKAEL